MYLESLYPELEDKWIARHEGTFYRNYNDDSLSADPDKAEVTLARAGFLKLLPQGLITSEEELKGRDVKGRYDSMNKRNHLLSEAFLPIDSFNFRSRLRIERQISDLLDRKLDYVLDRCFGIRVGADTDPYVREAAYLLPYVSRRRGDMLFVRELLETLVKCPVEMKRGRYSGTDNTRAWMPLVRYDLLVPGLDAQGYRQKTEQIRPLCNFLLEWFIPVDVICRFGIKQGDGAAENGAILDYNVVI